VRVREIQHTTLFIVAGALLGGILGVGLCCGRSWHQGGSIDPRCAVGLEGYATLRFTDASAGDRIRCVYQPMGNP
jgi:hypothetical protein